MHASLRIAAPLLVGAAFLFACAGTSYAETSNMLGVSKHASSTSEAGLTKDQIIAKLRLRILELEKLVATLRAQQGGNGLMKPIGIPPGNFCERANLRLTQGVSGDDVKAIQEWLAAMPDVFPEGSVTGFFGPLTKQAIMRFQVKNGMTASGEVNAELCAKIKKVKEGNSGSGNGNDKVRFNNGKGIPVCVSNGTKRETKFANNVEEFRRLLSSGAKAGPCNKSDTKDNDDDDDDDTASSSTPA